MHKIKANAKNGTNEPVITVKTSKENIYAHTVKILGGSDVIYRPDKPLSCGAKVWIETYNSVTAYRRYYNNDKKYFAKWEKGRSCPEWWVQ